ncbi:MAG: hypothetical protein KAQ87_04065 [Candidatus Pacebacteria bacterium]|nr:hypothetical protein [Candidatus Paceibacterota bacterium]
MKLKPIIHSILFGIILFFVASGIASILELGGFNVTTGKNNFPVGFPIPCYERVDCIAEYMPEFGGYLSKPGCSNLKFLPTLFILDLIIWIVIVYLVILLMEYRKKRK